MHIFKLYRSTFFKKIRWRILIFVLSLLLTTAFIYLFEVALRQNYLKPSEYTVLFTEKGFVPQDIIMRQGDTVVFLNKTKEYFWPASSFHPTHKIYPEFDSKTFIGPGEEWSFMFMASGRWKYHDHLFPSKVGTVIVKDSGLIQKRCETKNEKIICWYNAIDAELQKGGLEAAFIMMENLYDNDPSFASGCHDITHILGEAAFRKFDEGGEVNTTPYSVFCSYGFYHGFIEAMLHSGQDYGQVISYCKQAEKILARDITSPQALVNCFHGIGHGIFDTLPVSYWGKEDVMINEVLKFCHTLEKENEEFALACAKGAFNALTNAYAFGNYRVQIDTENPFRLCRAQSTRIDKIACYVDLGVYVTNRMDVEQAVQIIETIEDKTFMAETLAAYINNKVQYGGDLDLLPFLQVCQEYEASIATQCRAGIIEGIFISGKIEDAHKRAFDFCSLSMLTEEERSHCFNRVINRIYVVLPKNKADDVCRTLVEYQDYCLYDVPLRFEAESLQP